MEITNDRVKMIFVNRKFRQIKRIIFFDENKFIAGSESNLYKIHTSVAS